MEGDLVVAPFGRLLPRPPPSPSWHRELPPESDVDRMMPRESFPKHGPVSGEASDQGQKLPPVSHILGGHGYHDRPPLDHDMAARALSIFPRPRYNRDGSGASFSGAPPFIGTGFPTQPITNQPYSAGSRALPLGPFPHPSLQEDSASRMRSLPPFLPPAADARMSSDSDASLEHHRTVRVVGEKEVPGKGLCFIYEDGSFCPKAIGGDSVNPQWGVTKAGKPRKRLAQACTTCREKKIRCDPGSGLAKCSQCFKFNRECRFEPHSGSRSSQRSPSTSTTNSPAMEAGTNPSPIFHRNSAASTDQSFPMPTSSKTSIDIGNSSSPSPFLQQSADVERPDHHQPHPAKRRKASVLGHDPGGDGGGLESDAGSGLDLQGRPPGLTIDPTSSQPVVLSPMWDQDPWDFDQHMTEYYLRQYFTKINYTTYCMFPKEAFMTWVRHCRDKSRWDKMLLYAMMAHGSIFASNSRRHSDGKTFSRIAHTAVGQSAGEFNLQVVQTRLILALYDFSQGNAAKAWDFTGAAVRAACGMRLNVEEGVTDVKDDDELDYGLNKATLIECRRRTFWSAYIMDRFNGFCSGHLAMFHNEDCLLRLPCNERMYEEGNIPLTPFFDNRKIDPQQFVYSDTNAPGMMAYLVQIASIWGEVLARAYRSRYQPPAAWGEAYEEFYQQTVARLDAWERSLGAHLRCSPGNIDRAGQSGHLGTYGALHTLYHCTMMRLNRHARHDRMLPQTVERNIKCAYEHACKTLDTMKAIAKHNRVVQGGQFGFAVSSPFTGFAVLTAIDILTSTGSMADFLSENSRSIELLAGGIDVMTELSEHWASAKVQLKLIERRFEDLMATVQSHGVAQHSRVAAFFSREPLEATFSLENDLVYALPKRRYLLALGWSIRDGDDMLEVLKRGSDVNMVSLSTTTI